MTDVEEFIKRRFKCDCNWLCGNCYYFAIILKNRFPDGCLVYDYINGHFMFKLNGMFFDYTGKITPEMSYIEEWESFKLNNPNRADRIIRDCIM